MPEICKKSLISSPATGGLELFIIGKNFLKDTRVIFQARRAVASPDSYDTFWEESVMPDKEFLQQVHQGIVICFFFQCLNEFDLSILFQTHLICTVPSYIDVDIVEPVTVQMLVTSSNKYSEPHNFVYTPKSTFGSTGLTMTPTLATLQHIHSSQGISWLFTFSTLTKYQVRKMEDEKKKEKISKITRDVLSMKASLDWCQIAIA